jgi:hypothetical protein
MFPLNPFSIYDIHLREIADTAEIVSQEQPPAPSTPSAP